MARNHGLSQKILDASWGRFFQLLFYKAERAGRMFLKVNPRGTTQKCVSCGKEVQKSLKDRMHVCPYCGFETDRDYNASLNILYAGLGQPFVPLEMKPLRVIPVSSVIEGGSPLR